MFPCNRMWLLFDVMLVKGNKFFCSLDKVKFSVRKTNLHNVKQKEEVSPHKPAASALLCGAEGPGTGSRRRIILEAYINVAPPGYICLVEKDDVPVTTVPAHHPCVYIYQSGTGIYKPAYIWL